MTTMVEDTRAITGGVDTHTDLHVAAALDSIGGLLAGAGALQMLTLELAQARHANPDLIRREQAPYRQAAHEAENSADW